MSAPRFLADEDLRYDIVRAVRRLEPTVEIKSVVELGLSGASDTEVLEFACVNHWLVVSHDVNTMRGLAAQRIVAGEGMAGLLLAPQTRSTRAIAESLLLIWSASQLGEWEERVEYLPL